MAKYTIELNKLVQSGYQVFDDTWTTFIPEHKEELCAKILRHYWFYEIGSETPDRFKFNINEHLARIMPYFNQLYASELLKIQPLYNYVMEHDDVSETDRKRARNLANRRDAIALREMADSIKRMMDGTQNLTGNMGLNYTETYHEDRDGTSALNHDENTSDNLKHDEEGTLNVSGSEDVTEGTTTSGNETVKDILSGTKDTTQNTTSNGGAEHRESDTPQAQVSASGLAIEETYLTMYSRDSNNNTTNSTTKEVLNNTDDKTTDTTGKSDTKKEIKKTEDQSSTKDYTDTATGTRDFDEDGEHHEDVDGTRTRTTKQDRTEDVKRTQNEHQFQNGTTKDTNNETAYTMEDEGHKESQKDRGVTKGITISQSKLLKEFRSTFINIDAQIISQLENNFMGVW